MVGIKGIRYIKRLILLAKSPLPLPAVMPRRAVSFGPQKVVVRLAQYVRQQHGHAWPEPDAVSSASRMTAAARSTGVLDGKHDMREESGSWADCQ
jgi:hypothetical protein